MAKATEKKVKVINNTTGSISFRGIDDKKYFFNVKGAYKMVDFAIIEGLYNESANFIMDGYVLLSPSNIYEDLGIGKDVVERLLSFSDISALLNEDSAKIEEVVKDLPNPIKENVAKMAKDMKIDSKSKSKAIKEATGFDIDEQIEDRE